MKDCLVIGIDGKKNREDTDKELSLEIPNAKKIIITSFHYVLKHPEKFLSLVKKIKKKGS